MAPTCQAFCHRGTQWTRHTCLLHLGNLLPGLSVASISVLWVLFNFCALLYFQKFLFLKIWFQRKNEIKHYILKSGPRINKIYPMKFSFTAVYTRLVCLLWPTILSLHLSLNCSDLVSLFCFPNSWSMVIYSLPQDFVCPMFSQLCNPLIQWLFKKI